MGNTVTITGNLVVYFPASRGLSRWGKNETSASREVVYIMVHKYWTTETNSSNKHNTVKNSN